LASRFGETRIVWNRLKMHLFQGRSHKFILGGYNFLLHDTTVLYTSSLTTSAAISAENNFQGLILGGHIYRYTPRRYAPDLFRHATTNITRHVYTAAAFLWVWRHDTSARQDSLTYLLTYLIIAERSSVAGWVVFVSVFQSPDFRRRFSPAAARWRSWCDMLLLALYITNTTYVNIQTFQQSARQWVVKQVLSSSRDGRPFGHNRRWKLGAVPFFWGGGAGSPSNTTCMVAGLWPTSVVGLPSGIIIRAVLHWGTRRQLMPPRSLALSEKLHAKVGFAIQYSFVK